MFRNYFKTAVRNFFRSKLFSTINILGLSIGLTCSILILLWVNHELSFDKFHYNYESIYRILQDMPFTKNATWAITQGPLAPGLAENFPEISNFARVANAGWQIRFEEDQQYIRGIYADSSFLNIFSFSLLKGNIRDILSNKYSVVITEKMAEKIFGDKEPLGQILKVYDYFDIEVTGVVKNPPTNSHLQFEFISTMAFAKEIGYSVDRWDNSGFTTYLLLPPTTSQEEVESKIGNFLDDKPTIEEGAILRLQPIGDIHLGSGIDYDIAINGNMNYVILFFGSAIFILIIACVNFMNLSTSRSMRRTREIGLRKTVGASRQQLILQFLMETTFLVIIAFVVALLLVHGVIQLINQALEIQFQIDYFESTYLIGFFILILFTILLAGFYPAFVLSAVRLSHVLKGTFSGTTGNIRFKKIMVILQFTTSIFLFIGTLAVYQQVQYLLNRDLGYDRENLMYILIHNNGKGYLENLKLELLKNPEILEASSSANFPTSGFQFSNDLWSWEGKDPSLDILFRAEYIDYDFFKTFGIPMKGGREFSRDFVSDSLAIIINETAADIIGFENPVGQSLIYNNDQRLTIVGVANDYHFRSLHTAIEPQVLILGPSSANYLWIRIQGENVQKSINYASNVWKEIAPDHDFNYGFLDEQITNLYKTEKEVGIILFTFSIMAIIILCLGLFGLLGYAVNQRNKEISIRKVFGARTLAILSLFSKEYAWLMIISTVIAIPLINYFITEWLQEFPYQMKVRHITFIIPLSIIFLISFLIIISQSLRATRINPAETLRNE